MRVAELQEEITTLEEYSGCWGSSAGLRMAAALRGTSHLVIIFALY